MFIQVKHINALDWNAFQFNHTKPLKVDQTFYINGKSMQVVKSNTSKIKQVVYCKNIKPIKGQDSFKDMNLSHWPKNKDERQAHYKKIRNLV
jgi:hypothetical protein